MYSFLDYEKIVREDIYHDWPVIANALNWQDLCLSWQMEYSERTALIAVLNSLSPSISIEIGTHSGGSLAVLSRFSNLVYSIDINPDSQSFLDGKFSNVHYLVGDSKQLIPNLLIDLQKTQNGPLFVLIDGDHSETSVQTDITNICSFRPRYPMVVMGHDSFNPGCRQGILNAPWSANPHVHIVEVDFVTGGLFSRLGVIQQMWGGLFFALLLPQERMGKLVISQRHQALFDTVLETSSHHKPSWKKKWLAWLGTLKR